MHYGDCLHRDFFLAVNHGYWGLHLIYPLNTQLAEWSASGDDLIAWRVPTYGRTVRIGDRADHLRHIIAQRPTLVSSQIARSGEHPFYVACSRTNELADSLVNAYPYVCSGLLVHLSASSIPNTILHVLLELHLILSTATERNFQHGVVRLWIFPVKRWSSLSPLFRLTAIWLRTRTALVTLLSSPIRNTTSAYRFPLSSFLLHSLFCLFSSFAHGNLILSIVPSRPCPLLAVKVTVCQWRLTTSSCLGISAPRKNLPITSLDAEASIIWHFHVNGRQLKQSYA